MGCGYMTLLMLGKQIESWGVVCAPCPAAARWSLCAPQVAAGGDVGVQFYNFIIGGRGSLFDGGGKWGAYKYFVLKLTQFIELAH